LAQNGLTSPVSLRGNGSLRLFAALNLPPAWSFELARWQATELGAPAGTRLVSQESLHVTLAFLGRRPAAEVERISAELRSAAAACTAPIRLVPVAYRETRSVGMLVLRDVDGWAAALAGDVQRRLAAAGVYRPPLRPWLPHVTVVRFRTRPGLAPALPAAAAAMPSDAALYHSELRSGGAQYVVIDTFSLGGSN
jgi:2'-5' RNA ligase